MIGMNLVKREPIYYTTTEDKALLTYHAVYCVACGGVIGRVPFAATDPNGGACARVRECSLYSLCVDSRRSRSLSSPCTPNQEEMKNSSTPCVRSFKYPPETTGPSSGSALQDHEPMLD